MIQVSQLQFGYGSHLLFDKLCLSANCSGVYGLFGRNGSGKSSLLKILSGLLFARAGVVEVLGVNPAARSAEFLEKIYLLPEEFHLPNINVAALKRTHAPFYPRFSRDDFDRYIALFQVPDKKLFGAMSLGQKKKAVMAFALATHTPVLLMDEPTNGLDIAGRAQFKEIMRGLEHANRIVLISTHQAHDLESLMRHVLFIDAGKLALSASIDTLRAALRIAVTPTRKDLEDSIYSEALGEQWVYVASNSGAPSADLNLELLYKALIVNRQAVLAAVNGAHRVAENAT